MTLKEIFAFLFLLVVMFIFANLWFHFVEAIWSQIKRLFAIHKDSPTWHAYPCEHKETKLDNNKNNIRVE